MADENQGHVDAHPEGDHRPDEQPESSGKPEEDLSSEDPQRQAYGVFKVIVASTVTAISMLVGLLLLLFTVMQTNWATKQASDFLVMVANPYSEAQIESERVRGNWVNSLRFYNVNLYRTEEGSSEKIGMAHIDSLEVRYNLLGLFRRTIHFREVSASGVDIHARQQEDGTWDLFKPFIPDEPDTTGFFALRMDDINLRRGNARADFYNPDRDSSLYVQDLNANLNGLFLSQDSTRFDLTSLRTGFTPPGEDLRRELDLSFSMANQFLTLRHIDLNSPYSQVAGRGLIRLPQEEGVPPMDDVDFELTAQPLDFRDLAGLVPGIDPTRSLELDLTAQGRGHLVHFDLDAAFSDGSSLVAGGRLSPFDEGGQRYDLTAELRQFDPYFFTDRPDQPNSRISADLSADLQGRTLEELRGPLHLSLYDAHYENYNFDRTELEAQFDDGRADIELSGGLRGTRLTASGHVRPFDPEPSYDLRTRFANLNIERLRPESGLTSNLTGGLHLRGQGLALSVADLRADLNLEPSVINHYEINSAQLETRLARGDVAFNGRVVSPQGGLIARGDVNDLEGRTHYRIAEGQLDGMDVAALTGDTTRSSINATFSLDGRGTDPQQMVIENANINVYDSHYGSYNIASAGLNANLRQGQLNIGGNLDMEEAGTFDLNATARPFLASRPWAITSATFQNADIGILAQQPEQSSRLNGRLTASGYGTHAPTMYLEGQVALDSSRLNEQVINEAQLDATLEQGNLAFDLDLHVPEGSTHLAGAMQPFEDPMTYRATGNVAALNIGALTAQPNLQTALFGEIELEGRGTDPETMELVATLQLADSRINQQQIDSGQLDVTVREGIADIDADVALPDGQIRTLAELNFNEPELAYQGNFIFDNVELHRILSPDTLIATERESRLSFNASIEGRGTELATMEMRGHAFSRQARFDRIRAGQMDLDFELRDGLLRVDNLLIRSNLVNAEGQGQLALVDGLGHTSDFHFDADIRSLDPIRPFLGADEIALTRGDITARIYGPSDRLRFDARADLESLVYNEIRAAGIRGTFSGEMREGFELRIAEADADIQFFSLPQFDTQNIDIQATYQDDEISFYGDFLVDDRRDAQIAGVFELHPERQQLRFEQFDMRLNGDEWELLREATISYNGEYRVRNLLLFSDDQQLAMDGVVDFDGEQNLAFTVENFRIDAVADLLGHEGLGGRANGSVLLTGPASAPSLQGELNLDLQSYEEPVGDLALNLDYDDLQLDIDANLAHRDGSQMSLEGYLPLDLRLTATDDTVAVTPELVRQREMNFALVADSFAIDWVRPFFDEQTMADLDGRLNAVLDITGTPGSPSMSGNALLTEGHVRFPDLGTAYRDIQANAEFTDDRARLNRLRIRSGDGQLTGSGTIHLTDLTLGEYDLDLRARNFLAINTAFYRAVADADLVLSGTTSEPRLEGGVRLISANIRLDDETVQPDVEEVELTDADIRTLEQRFGKRIREEDVEQDDLFEALAMDIDLLIERDTWIRSRANPNMDIQITGDLDLQKRHFDELQLFGSVEVVPERSRIAQFGRRFNISDGLITFNGPVDDPVIDVQAAYEVPSRRDRQGQVMITLGITGRLGDLELDLRSDPSMESTDIASYLVTGRPAGQGFLGGGTGTTGEVAGQLALGQLTTFLEGAAGAELGLDVVEIEQDRLRGVTMLTAGSYVSPRLFLAISQPVDFASRHDAERGFTGGVATQFTLEYELTRGLLMRLISRNYIQLNLLWEHSY